jgi:hypothetical protein
MQGAGHERRAIRVTRGMVRKSSIESAGLSGRSSGRSPVGYSIAPWAGFGEALAAVAGALTGLLFVAPSQVFENLWAQ